MKAIREAMDKVLDYEDITIMFNILMDEYHVDVPLMRDQEMNHIMAFDVARGVILINEEKCTNMYKTLSVKDANYVILFAIHHELNHVLQSLRDDELGKIYEHCFSYTNSLDHSISAKLRQIIYETMHDYFPSEINADIKSYMAMINFLKDVDEEAMKRYQELLINRLLRLYQNNDFLNFYKDVLNLPYPIPYSLEESLIYGLPYDIHLKRETILKLLK